MNLYRRLLGWSEEWLNGRLTNSLDWTSPQICNQKKIKDYFGFYTILAYLNGNFYLFLFVNNLLIYD